MSAAVSNQCVPFSLSPSLSLHTVHKLAHVVVVDWTSALKRALHSSTVVSPLVSMSISM
jgi:hypothetical protein